MGEQNFHFPQNTTFKTSSLCSGIYILRNDPAQQFGEIHFCILKFHMYDLQML
jgi:hypothetical protein